MFVRHLKPLFIFNSSTKTLRTMVPLGPKAFVCLRDLILRRCLCHASLAPKATTQRCVVLTSLEVWWMRSVLRTMLGTVCALLYLCLSLSLASVSVSVSVPPPRDTLIQAHVHEPPHTCTHTYTYIHAHTFIHTLAHTLLTTCARRGSKHAFCQQNSEVARTTVYARGVGCLMCILICGHQPTGVRRAASRRSRKHQWESCGERHWWGLVSR